MDPRQRPATANHPEHQNSTHTIGSNGGNLSYRVLVVLLIIASLLGIGFLLLHGASALTADTSVKTKQYQALFLTNGQVYFGHLARTSSSYVTLKDIYYLQVQQQVQPGQATDKNSTQQPQVSLAKLGGELHGPEDIMYVSRTQVLFWENLKSDGKVAKAIADYKAGGNK